MTAPTGRFDMALSFALLWEGGYVNDPDDPGGATNRGVTQKTYDHWRLARGQPNRSVRDIEDEEVASIYRNGYWNPVAAALPAPIDICAFDTAVNCGVARTLEWIAQVYAKDTPDPGGAAVGLLHCRMRHYDRLVARRPAMKKFWRGWMRRIEALAQSLQVDF